MAAFQNRVGRFHLKENGSPVLLTPDGNDMCILCYIADLAVVSLIACVAACLFKCDTDRELAPVFILRRTLDVVVDRDNVCFQN